ncbi:hypothetical protein Asulf_00054 [Archaeoglobus sulfaticallidus PM70-1]|uniref:Uncharacterized protein n=1 Tax=Archaeoglobus sulfaticallidus PM70-1 TaxID=387631 RepID=N0BIX0_9EURY|nr:hypothetical protein [Archaeoglobus sulfaticallidus]AGK60090.1 hypothetical protein Asulf_00054 [Archaeoglobus sulfaticallidus PM70-1]
MGVGKGTSVLELAKMIKKIVDYEGEVILDTSKKPDEHYAR